MVLNKIPVFVSKNAGPVTSSPNTVVVLDGARQEFETNEISLETLTFKDGGAIRRVSELRNTEVCQEVLSNQKAAMAATIAAKNRKEREAKNGTS